MVKRESRCLFVWVLVALWFFGAVSLYAEDDVVADSTSAEAPSKSPWMWPVEHIIQPFLNGLIYPIAQPVDYALKNGIIDKSVQLISFGEDYKIMVYPSFNFKPGSRSPSG